MEALRSVQEESEKKYVETQLELSEVELKLAETIELLKNARVTNDQLVEECGQLKVVVTQQKEVEGELRQKNQVLTDELSQANEKVSKLNASVVHEHEEGFTRLCNRCPFC